MQPAVKKEPCNSCRETPTFQYSYYNSGQRLPSNREAVYLCAKCRCYIPEVGTPDQSKERHAIGNARKRMCCHPRCLTPGSILTVVHCSKKFCYDLNYHRVCYEDLKHKGGHSVSSSAVVETKVSNRTVYQAYCANHVPPPPRAAIRQTANANAANQRLQASSRSVAAVDAGEDSERKIPKKAGLQSKEEHAAAHEARAALLQGRAATERNRRISTQKLMDGTETKAAQDLLKKLQDTLGDPILVEACANLDQYSEKLELMLSQLSPSTKCSVVGPTGVGKSFFINCLLSCTETPHEIYASGQLRVFKPDGSIDLEAFHDRPSSYPLPKPYFVAAGARAHPDDDAAVKGVKRVVVDGKIPPGTPGWLLTSESLGDVTTRANVTVAYGRTFHLKVYFYTKKEAKQMAFQRCQLDSSSTTAEVRFANSCWDLLVDTKRTPKNVDDPNDIVLKSGLPKLDTTEIYAGLGKDSTADRQFVREQLKSLMARQNSVEQLLIKSVIVYSPSAALIGTRITDVMGSNDANVVRTARTRVAINNSDALLVVLSKSLTAEANVVRMLEDSVFLEQLIENNSAKQLRVIVAVERGLSLCKLTDFNDQKTKMKFDKFFRTCENETREQLKKMLTHVAVAKGFPNPEARVSQAMQLRVSIHCIWPALFWSLRLSRLGGSDELKRTGMLQALGMQRFLDVSATLSGFQQCIGVSDGDEKELKIEGSIAADLEANITARLSEFQDSSEEVEDLRETAELWAQPTSVEKWDTLKKNYETQLSDVHTAWRKAARKRISSFQKRIRTHVLVPNSTTEARVQKLLRDVSDSNKAIKLKARSTPGDLSRALFDSVKRIPFEELNAELKSLFEEFLEGDFKKLFVDMLEVIFDRKSVVSKSFQPVQERIWRVAKSKAFQYYNLILFDPQLKDNYEVSNLVALQQKAQLTALRDIQQSCFADWMEIEGVSQLRQQCAKDLQKVYSAVCNHLEIQWDGIAKHKMNLFHDLLFSKVQPSVKLPQGLEQAAESECLLHATLRTCVEDATAMGVANDPAIKLPIEELKALQLNLQKWKIDAENMHEKLKNLVKYPREWMENVGERLCGIQAPPPAAGPAPSSSTAPVPVSRAPRTGAVRAACPPPGPAAVPRPSAPNPRVAGVVRAPVVDLTSPEADTGAVPRPLQRRRMNPVPQVISTRPSRGTATEKEDGEIDDDEDMLQAPPLRRTRSQTGTTADMDADIESPAHSPAPRSSRVVAEHTRKPSRR